VGVWIWGVSDVYDTLRLAGLDDMILNPLNIASVTCIVLY